MTKINQITVESLIAQYKCTNRPAFSWIDMGKFHIYVRATKHLIENQFIDTIDIANVEVQEQYRGKGIFTKWLDSIELLATKNNLIVYIECILQPRFAGFFVRRGYQLIVDKQNKNIPPCAFKKFGREDNNV